MAANYRHIGGGENRLGRHYSRFSAFWPPAAPADQSLALRKSQNAGSNRRSRANSVLQVSAIGDFSIESLLSGNHGTESSCDLSDHRAAPSLRSSDRQGKPSSEGLQLRRRARHLVSPSSNQALTTTNRRRAVVVYNRIRPVGDGCTRHANHVGHVGCGGRKRCGFRALSRIKCIDRLAEKLWPSHLLGHTMPRIIRIAALSERLGRPKHERTIS